jgi:hypothetical protein
MFFNDIVGYCLGLTAMWVPKSPKLEKGIGDTLFIVLCTIIIGAGG